MKDRVLVCAREIAGLNQIEAAEKCEVSRVTYNRWENDMTILSPGRRARMCVQMGVDIAEAAKLVETGSTLTPSTISTAPKPAPNRPNGETWLVLNGVKWPSWSLDAKARLDAALAANGGWNDDGTCPSDDGKSFYCDLPPNKRVGAEFDACVEPSREKAAARVAFVRRREAVTAAGMLAVYNSVQELAAREFAGKNPVNTPAEQKGLAAYIEQRLANWWARVQDDGGDLV